MRTFITLFVVLATTIVSSQQMIVPSSILTQGRINFYTKHYLSTSVNENGIRLYLHADLFSSRYPSFKIAADYYRHDHFSSQEDIETLRLKANYNFRISRKISLVLSGSGGISKPSDPTIIYSGGLAFNSRNLFASYHLFNQGSGLLHTIQFYTSPIITFNKDSKYSRHSGISLYGNYTINSTQELNYCSNYIKANLEMNNINISIGMHESANHLRPNVGITLKNIEFFDFSTFIFLNKGYAPDVQVAILFKRRRFRHRGFIHISNPNF